MDVASGPQSYRSGSSLRRRQAQRIVAEEAHLAMAMLEQRGVGQPLRLLDGVEGDIDAEHAVAALSKTSTWSTQVSQVGPLEFPVRVLQLAQNMSQPCGLYLLREVEINQVSERC